MCRTLYRFEDKYGMHTIVSAFKNFPKETNFGIYKFGDIYVQYGLSCIPCLCVADTIEVCRELNIERIVLIFDLDGPQGGMLSFGDIYKRYTLIDNVEILYYPVAWCAETLLHYQICSDITDAEVYPVPKRVRKFLEDIIGSNVKKTELILDKDLLEARLLELDRSNLLCKEIIEFMLGIADNAFTIGTLKKWMARAEEKYTANYGWWKR